MQKLSGVKIVVADDEPYILEILKDVLEEQGAIVRVAENGQVAMRALLESESEVLLSNVRMAGGDGISLIKNIRAKKNLKPLIFLCTGAMEIDEEEVSDLGVKEVFYKPFQGSAVVDTIASALADTDWRTI